MKRPDRPVIAFLLLSRENSLILFAIIKITSIFDLYTAQRVRTHHFKIKVAGYLGSF